MDIRDRILSLIPAQPWWVYALLILLPLFFLLALREFVCWFWKINRTVDSLERLEITLKELRDIMERAVTRRTSAQAQRAAVDPQAAAKTVATPAE